MRVCVCVRVFVCVRACVRAHARACVCVCDYVCGGEGVGMCVGRKEREWRKGALQRTINGADRYGPIDLVLRDMSNNSQS